MGLALIKLTQTDYLHRAESMQTAQMLVIPYSHFCELATWALEIAKLRYEVHGLAPGEHLFPVLALRKGGDTNYISSSSHVQPVKGRSAPDPAKGQSSAKEAGNGSTAVPILVMPDRRVLTDSWDIVKESKLPPIDDDIKSVYDEELGPLTRQLVYHYLLSPAHCEIWNGLCTEGYSLIWRTVWNFGFGGQVIQNYVEV
jgi:hypothetical protein